MAKMKKIIVAGSLVKVAIYPVSTRWDSQRARGAKKKMSSEAQKRMNAIYSWQKLELLLAANFRQGDLVLTFTYDDEHLPEDRKSAEAKLKYFRSKLSAKRRADGSDLVMFWSTENKHGDGRYHHHAVINATGDDYDIIKELWSNGSVEISKLSAVGEKSYATQARYMCKEERERLGQRSWSYTRNAKKPEVESFRVEDDTTVNAPKGSTVLEEASSKTEFGFYKYVKYMAAGWNKSAAPRAKRRRRKVR